MVCTILEEEVRLVSQVQGLRGGTGYQRGG